MYCRGARVVPARIMKYPQRHVWALAHICRPPMTPGVSFRFTGRSLRRSLCVGPLGARVPPIAPRYMLYFRVRHAGWGALAGARALEADLWCDLEGTWAHLGRE